MNCNEKPGADNGPSEYLADVPMGASHPSRSMSQAGALMAPTKAGRRAAMIAATDAAFRPAKPSAVDWELAQNVRRAWDALVDAMDAAEQAGLTVGVIYDETEAYRRVAMRRAGLKLDIRRTHTTHY